MWYRLYTEVLDDPKMQRLPGELFKALINIWCIAKENNGLLPDIDDLTFRLRYVTRDVTVTVLNDLEARGFLDRGKHGFRPHKWDERQFISDNGSAARTRKYRKNQKLLEPPKSVTSQRRHLKHQSDTTRAEQNRTESDSERKDSSGREATPTRVYSEQFEVFWKIYPKRKGDNPKRPAFQKFEKALQSGIDLQVIMAGVKHLRAEAESRNEIGTPYVPMAQTWLHQARWEAAQQLTFLDRPERAPLP